MAEGIDGGGIAGVSESETPDIKQHKAEKCIGSRWCFKKFTAPIRSGAAPYTKALAKAAKKNRFAINNLCDFYCYVPNECFCCVVVIILPRTLLVRLLPAFLLLPSFACDVKIYYLPYSGALWLIANQRQFKGNKKCLFGKNFFHPLRTRSRRPSLVVASSNNAEDKLTLDNFSLDSSLPKAETPEWWRLMTCWTLDMPYRKKIQLRARSQSDCHWEAGAPANSDWISGKNCSKCLMEPNADFWRHKTVFFAKKCFCARASSESQQLSFVLLLTGAAGSGKQTSSRPNVLSRHNLHHYGGNCGSNLTSLNQTVWTSQSILLEHPLKPQFRCQSLSLDFPAALIIEVDENVNSAWDCVSSSPLGLIAQIKNFPWCSLTQFGKAGDKQRLFHNFREEKFA